MLPARFAPLLFALILSGVMSFLVSGIATFRTLGMVEGFLPIWLTNWAYSYAVAFPVAFGFGPLVRRLVARITVPG